MAAYLTLTEFKVLSVMPAEDVAAVETAAAGYVDAQLAEWQSRMDALLRKRYDAPFAGPVSPIVKGWLARLVTPRVYLRRGVNPSDSQFEAVAKDAADAWEEIKQAADSAGGTFDLPLSATASGSAVVSGGPLGYSEQSPYVWTTLQRDTAESEDGR